MEQEKKNKKCTKCGRELPLTEFYRNKATKDGLSVYCKSCCYEYLRQLRDVKRRELAIKRTIKR